ncbi:glycoside hydrolase superfamily [Aspergillus cavernicola]|uniref:chitinase n=1 Tax=Aspergillus cavernicola TaxID=176166 RepID=A0ABR4ITQ2_9EURO
MLLKYGALALAAQSVAGLRFAMYIDQYHPKGLPGKDQTQEITHAIMGFAASTLFNSSSPQPYKPFEPVLTMRNRFSPNTKLLIAIGGWGDSAGFSDGAKDAASRDQYAKNVAAMLDSVGFDGVDIDWEYPGGNGENYKKVPNSEKVSEIETYPLFLEALRKAMGKEKIISIATPGKRGDMIAYTAEQGPKIWPSVDIINVMSYDLMNRRDNATNHHSSVVDSLDAIHAYLEIGAPPEKLNLGFAYYAKWFTTKLDADCESYLVGCPVVVMENADGSDNGKSGAVTFESQNMAPALAASELKISTDSTCGLGKGTKCPPGSCCSQYGSCGTGDDFCQAGCLSDYGECKGVSITDSWRLALKNGKTDEELGGQYYMDMERDLFWTWDTPVLMTRKFKKIVEAEKLGGVMAWSLGEDTYDWSHLKAMQEGVAHRPLVSKMKSFIFVFLVSVSLAIPIPNFNQQHQQPLLESNVHESNPVSSLEISHGTFIHANKTHEPPDSGYTHALHDEQLLHLLLEHYLDELFAVGLLLLIPITLGIVDLAEHLSRCMLVEEFPERGRDKHRLKTLKERDEWVLRRKEREMRLERSRSWWKCSRP